MIRSFLACIVAAGAFAQSDAPKDLQLFLLIGQSNMAGRGAVEDQDRRPVPRAFALNQKNEWAPAVDPLHFDKPDIAGVGLGRSFARYLAARNPSLSIGLVPAAFGGSALDEWKPDGKHYQNAVDRTRAALKSGRLRGILWHQGEADSKPGLATTYRQRFSDFITRLRTDLGAPDVPVIIGQLGEFYQPDAGHSKTVNEQLALIPLSVPRTAFVSSAGLKHKGDNIHFDSPSLREFGRRYALAFLSLDPGWAAADTAATRTISPDRKAYYAATAIADPAKKIAALEKFKTDFPDSPIAAGADEVILSTLARKFPEQKGRIREKAKAMYRAADAGAQGRVANTIADTLLEAGVHLKDAQSWADKAIKPLNESAYLAEQRAAAEKRKQKPPSEEELLKRYRELRAGRIVTLGRIHVKRGETARGRKLLEEAWAANPNLYSAAAALGELAAASGNDQQALEYLMAAKLSGRAPLSAAAALESVYRKLHKGSLDGFELMLDAEYRKRFPSPINVEKYKPGPKRSDRVVLTELFTGAGCPPCVAADLAVDAVLEKYSPKDVAVVVYHQHIPRPDPMTNPDTRARAGAYQVNGVPTITVDGKKSGGGGPRSYAMDSFKRLDTQIAKALEAPAEARLTATGMLSGPAVKVHASADSIRRTADLKLHIALIERELRYAGENGIRFHPMVVRALATHNVAAAGGAFETTFDLDKITAANRKHLDEYEKTGRSEPFQFSEKKHLMDPAGLAAVVFLEDPAARAVLQAVWVDLKR